MKNVLFSLLLILLPCAGVAQVKVSGKVKGSDDANMAYTTVRLLKSDSTFVMGTVTDTLGHYQFNDVSKNNYLLAFSTIGYKSQITRIAVSDKNINVPLVTLESDNVWLGEVVVKGNSFVRQKDRVLIHPDKQQIKHASTGYDLLNNLMIPGIDVDRHGGKVSTIGGEVSLYINGKKAEYREVKNLRPKDIERVEYFDMPSGEYSGDVASINYITKEVKTGGYVSLDARQTIGYLNGDYNVAAKLAKGNTSYTFFAGHKMQKYSGIHYDKNEHFNFPDNAVERHYTTDDAQVKNNAQYMELSVLNKNKKRTLQAKASLQRSDEPDNYNHTSMNYTKGYDLSTRSLSSSDNSSLMPRLELYGKFSLPNKQTLTATLNGRYTKNEYARSYSEDEQYSQTDVNEQLYNLSASLIYSIKMKNQNSFTAQMNHFHKVSSTTYQGDYNKWQHLWTGESLLFLNYTQMLGKKFTYMLNLGVSSLQYHLHGEEHVSEFSPRGNLMLNYQLTPKQLLNLGISIGNMTPSLSYINDVDQTIDFLQIKRGNPYLDNTRIYNYSLSYMVQAGQFNMQFVGQYTLQPNYIYADYYVENGKLINSYASDMDYHSLLGLASITWRASEKLRFKVDGRWFRTILDGGQSDTYNTLYGNFQMNYYIKDFSLQFKGRTPIRTLTPFSGALDKMPWNYGLALMWNHKNWQAEVGANNFFSNNNRYVYRFNSDCYSYENTQRSKIDQQSAYVKLAYTFDFGKKTSRDKKTIEAIESGISK